MLFRKNVHFYSVNGYLKAADISVHRDGFKSRRSAEDYLESLLENQDFVIYVNSTEKGKSSPEIFEEVCKQMCVEKEYVLVVEDSVTPLKTAFEAGFLVVAVYDKYSHPYDEEKKQYSHKFVNSLLELIEK